MENGPSNEPSPQGRRVLLAIVTGAAGDRIQRWREGHDPAQARRLPPHVTLCYWAPADLDLIGKQVRHAFAETVTVRLGRARPFSGPGAAWYVEVLDSEPLDAARARLHDGAFVALPPLRPWTWHITCVRDASHHDPSALAAAAAALQVAGPWRIDTVACMELQGDRYVTLAEWRV